MRLLALILAAAALAGCSTNNVMHSASKVPENQTYTYSIEQPQEMSVAGLAEFRTSFESALRAANLHVLEGQPDQPANVSITVVNYYMRHGAARALVGVMAGRDSIRSRVRVVGSQGQEIALFEVESYNATALGTSGGMIENHAKEIVDRLLSLKKAHGQPKPASAATSPAAPQPGQMKYRPKGL